MVESQERRRSDLIYAESKLGTRGSTCLGQGNIAVTCNTIEENEKGARTDNLRRGELTDENLGVQKELLLRIELSLEQEEIIWVQRARANWLKHGDCNTIFFINLPLAERRRTQLKALLITTG